MNSSRTITVFGVRAGALLVLAIAVAGARAGAPARQLRTREVS